jgi:beta-lactamase regulating signal transducer with metallopeptidase domain
MTTSLIDVAGSIWRASWQASAIALLVWMITRCCGGRLAPRWCHLLWCVVLVRLLCPVIPATPWSIFNLFDVPSHAQSKVAVSGIPAETRQAPAEQETTPADSRPADRSSWHSDTASTSLTIPSRNSDNVSTTVVAMSTVKNTEESAWLWKNALIEWSCVIWLTGCALMTLKLVATAIVLRRQLTACRRVMDTRLLELLIDCCSLFGIRRTPALLVTPECISPCIVGLRRPKIVLPELLATHTDTERVRHVLAHELAHIVRYDLWTNCIGLTARTLHWFNPLAWWAMREMQAARESACDDLAVRVLRESDRSAYAATLVELAEHLSPYSIVAGTIRFFSSTTRLRVRIERVMRAGSIRSVRTPIAAMILCALVLCGLTDSRQKTTATASPVAASPQHQALAEGEADGAYVIRGRCVDDVDESVMAGVTVRLYRVTGRAARPTETAQAISDVEGRYSFTRLAPPRNEWGLDYLKYLVLGFAEGRPIGIQVVDGSGTVKEESIIRLARTSGTLSGQVVNAAGQPVKSAHIEQFVFVQHAWPLIDAPAATTDDSGRFTLSGIPAYTRQIGPDWGCIVRHDDHPTVQREITGPASNVVITLPTGCLVTGTVVDRVTGQPAATALISALRTDEWGEVHTAPDASGKFRLILPDGRYHFLAAANDRVCVALTEQECAAGEKVTLPAFELTAGGFIEGRVINAATGQAILATEYGEPLGLGLIGPSLPYGRSLNPKRLAEPDREGHYRLRAAPGANYPYLFYGSMALVPDAQQQPPVIVKEGETTTYDLSITPELPAEQKLQAAQRFVDSLPTETTERTAAILQEFRRLDRTLNEKELWCLLMRDLVTIGHDAVPQLCAELEQTNENCMLRRMGFALRAIGDPRAIPALIRAISKTASLSSSDSGFTISDKNLLEFMQTHDLDPGKDGDHFDMGRPVREVFGALHHLTGQDFGDDELFQVHLSDAPRRQFLQRQLFARQAQRWQAWWNENGRNLTDDPAYQQVQLPAFDEPLPPASERLGPTARLGGSLIGVSLSPPIPEGSHPWHFYDLDIGRRLRWPAELPRDKSARDDQRMADWASQRGVDLMCAPHRTADGNATYVLRAVGMRVWELSQRELRNFEKLVAAEALPHGDPTGEFLIPRDAVSEDTAADAHATFLYVTREGNWGVIELNARSAGPAYSLTAPGKSGSGISPRRVVMFNLIEIVP